jgi:hypothetical protein
LGINAFSGAAEHGAHVGGVLAAAVEIGVVPDGHRQVHGARRYRPDGLFAQGAVVPQFAVVRRQQRSYSRAQPAHGRLAVLQQGIEGGRQEGFRRYAQAVQ